MPNENGHIEKSLDVLFEDVKKYRQSAEYFKLLKFSSKFKNFGVYNSIMINMQRPSAKYLMTAREWKDKWNREIKEDAIPIITLIPFGPIAYNYDISDTKCIGPENENEEELLKRLAAPYSTNVISDRKLWSRVEMRLLQNGIIIDDRLIAGGSYAGKISLLDSSLDDSIPINQNSGIPHKVYYKISINSKAELGEKIATVCHELGHLHCMHISSPGNWWKVRNIGDAAEEFEAESVSWLLCNRLGIHNPSEEYLSGYVQNNNEIPPISVDAVVRSFDSIWHILSPNSYSIKKSLLYRYDKNFKSKVDNFLSSRNVERSGQFRIDFN